MTVSHRERVLAALTHIQPDRVPMDMMGNGTMLLDKVYFDLRNYFGLPQVAPFRTGTNANYYDERILEILDIDFRRVFLHEKRKQADYCGDGSFKDIWGICYRKSGDLTNIINHPLCDVQSMKEIEEYDWPAPESIFECSGLKDEAKKLHEKTDYAIVARNPVTAGFLDRACSLAGMESFLVMMSLYPEMAHLIINKILSIHEKIYTMFLDGTGHYVQIVETGDDLGTMQSLLISPDMYREFIKPADMRLNGLIHEKAPGAKLFKHCDGNIFDIIGDLIETGVEILNPVQSSIHGMEIRRLKNTFGNSLCFHGGLENIAGEENDVLGQARELVDVLGEKGGYIFASCNHIVEARPERIIDIFKNVRGIR